MHRAHQPSHSGAAQVVKKTHSKLVCWKLSPYTFSPLAFPIKTKGKLGLYFAWHLQLEPFRSRPPDSFLQADKMPLPPSSPRAWHSVQLESKPPFCLHNASLPFLHFHCFAEYFTSLQRVPECFSVRIFLKIVSSLFLSHPLRAGGNEP